MRNKKIPTLDPSILGISRREMLSRFGAGFGTLGLQQMLSQTASADAPSPSSPLFPKAPHFAPKAKRIIQLFMPGGPSQVDTFDHKPLIEKYSGQRPELVDRKSLRNTKNGLMKSPFGFKQYGESGKWVSDIFPKVAEKVDDLCFIHSMHTDIPEHAGAILMFNLGHIQAVRPSLGSWLVYGLGAETDNLPGFVAMSPHAQARGKTANYSNSFLPGAYSGCYVNINSMHPDRIVSDLKNQYLSRGSQREQADLLAQLNQIDLRNQEQDAALESSIQAMEMAFRMQFAVPEAFDVTRETQKTLDLYGPTQYAKGCLLARRLVERGVRMVQLSLTIDGYDIAWDTGHGDIVGGHKRLADACDQGIAALLEDLKQRGMLEDTLVMWGGNLDELQLQKVKRAETMTITDSLSGWLAEALSPDSPMEPLMNLD